MRILVTGAAGFIGSHIARAYSSQGHQVAGVDNLSTGKRENLPADFPLSMFDLSDDQQLQALLRDFRPEVISHHAAQVNVRRSWENPIADLRSNILASVTLFRIVSETVSRPRIIYSSSGGAIYGEPRRLPVKESHPVHPTSNYGVSKYAAELYLSAFQGNGLLRSVIFRYPNVFGPGQDPAGEAGVVAVFTNQLLRGIQPHIFGDGSKTRDYTYVDDVVDANLRALKFQGTGVFNLGCGKEISDREVFRAVRTAVGSKTEPIFEEKRPGEVDHICLDTRQVRQTLGWKPRVTFREGVKRVVNYWKQRI
ncbi:MAG TPA: NAD-dependent epimerase/dehydratase family protein [Candidatus Acidoferrum sp.]|nr:NAD-dependent epimerase/dehydratase family protein [Candidatus Acidoferrum sp.]